MKKEQLDKLPALSILRLDNGLSSFNCAGVICTECPLALDDGAEYSVFDTTHKTWCARVYIAALALAARECYPSIGT